MNRLKILAIVIGAMVVAQKAIAQSPPAADTTNMTAGKKLFYNGGMLYMSNLTYAGRKDASSVPVLLPNFTVVSKGGLFVSAMGYFDLSGANSQSEGLSVTPGYVFSFDQKKQFGGSVSATKYFITSNSPIILSSFNFTVDGQLTYTGFVKIALGASLRVGKDSSTTDIVNNVELSKEIWLLKSGQQKTNGFKIGPDLNLYTGTQSFYQTYYTQSQVQRAVTNPSSSNALGLLFPGNTSQSIVSQTVTQQKQQQVKQYNLLALSASMPLTYAIGKVQLSLTPYFIKPFNQVDYTNNTPMNGWYFLFTAGVSATF